MPLLLATTTLLTFVAVAVVSHRDDNFHFQGCEVIQTGLTPGEKAQILKAHNDMRLWVATGKQKGQPPAANMKELKWSSELEEFAQEWIDKCTYARKNQEQLRTETYKMVGENMFGYMEPMQTKTKNTNVQSWFNQVDSFLPAVVDGFWSGEPSFNGYTQIVWANTEAVGCGFIKFKNGDWFKTLFVCNYGPAGNILTARVYERGDACSRCFPDNGCSTRYPGLCAKK